MKNNGILSFGIFTAIASSLCCITPVLALLAGTSGFAASFSWLEPLRPYLIGLTALVLGFAWYQQFRKQQTADIDCNCDEEKPSFLQSKRFLGIITVFAGLMLAFPSYSHIFFPQPELAKVDGNSINTIEFGISGMTCAGCEGHVTNEIQKLKGISELNVSYENGNAVVSFDPKKSKLEDLTQAIDKTGYKVTYQKTIEK